MFSERDLLVKYIFQELKVRARSLFVDIFEVDLRWGITEEQSQNNELVLGFVVDRLIIIVTIIFNNYNILL